MSDIFLSYSSKDRPIANHIQAALEAAGFSVFWDQETPPGKDWNSWIGEKLNLSRLAIVLWSKTSVASRNVVHEATIAVEKGKLIPAMVEDLKPGEFPMGFYTMQSADLRGFHGQSGHAGMAKLLAAVEERLGRRAPGVRVQQTVKAPPRRGPPWPLIGGGAVALALGIAVFGGAFRGQQAVENAESAVATPVDPVAQTVGRWRWTGIECGAGPTVARDGDTLVIAMTDTPTFTHAVESVTAATVHTIVVAPENFRGTQYELTRTANTLEVKSVADGKIDTWEACP